MQRQKKQWPKIIVFLAIFVLALLFPYSNDDWAWGSSTGLMRLHSLFKDYNGRYLGNLLVILLTRNNILKALVMSGTFTGIATLCQRIVNKDDNRIFYIVLTSLFLSDKALLRQTIVNTSGFTNYTFCMLLVLIYIAYLSDSEKTNRNKSDKTKTGVCIMLFLLGACSALFMEHITIYIILLSGFVCIMNKVRKHIFTPDHFSYFIGSVSGAVLMFTNGAYMKVVHGSDMYREASSTTHDAVTKACKNLFLTLSENTISNQIVVNVIVALMIIYLLARHSYSKDKKKAAFSISGIIITLAVNMYFVAILLNNDWMPLLSYTNALTGVIAVVYYVFLLVCIANVIKDSRSRKRMLFYLISIGVLTAPLLVLSPVTPRCALPMYVFYILLMCELYSYTIAEKLNGKHKKLSDAIFVFCFCFAFLYLLSIYSYVFHKNNQRLSDIKTQVNSGNQIIYLQKNHYEQYVWKNYPVSDLWAERFLDFYGFPKNLKVRILKKDNDNYEIYTHGIPKDTKKLMIVAHPDDELIWGGSRLFADDWFVVCITNGDNKTRHKELDMVMKETGDSYLIMNFPDKVDGKKSDWSKDKEKINKYLSDIINMRDWDEIVTHNPAGEYGHIHHKMTSEMVTNLVDDKSKLIYFGIYYPEKTLEKTGSTDKNGNPIGKISEDDYRRKQDIFKRDYPSQKNIPFYHMFTYENWVSYSDWETAYANR